MLTILRISCSDIRLVVALCSCKGNINFIKSKTTFLQVNGVSNLTS